MKNRQCNDKVALYEKKSVVIDIAHGLIDFLHLMMQVKSTKNEKSAKIQSVLSDDNLTISSMTTRMITAFVDYPSDWNITVSFTPLDKLIGTAGLLISCSMSTISDKEVAIKVMNTTD